MSKLATEKEQRIYMLAPILSNLKNELERVYISGSTMARNDPRLKKHIPGLIKLGERAPVFNNLANKLTALTQDDSTPESLMEAGSIIFSLIYSQGKTDNDAETRPIEYETIPLAVTRTGFFELNNLMLSIKPKAFNTPEILLNLYEQNRHHDPRLYKSFVKCVKTGNTKTGVYDESGNFREVPTTDIAGKLIIPSLGPSIIPVIKNELDVKGGAGDARLFLVLYSKIGKDILPLSEQVLEEGSTEVLAAALHTLAEDEKYTEILEKYTKDRRKLVKEAAAKALSNMKRG